MKLALIGKGPTARPVPQRMAVVIEACLRESGGTLSSGLRTQQAVAWARARGAVLQSQAELYDLFVRGIGNPANPPGYGTHELRSDGVAFPAITRGAPIPWWAVGLDVGTVSGQRYCDAARKLGWVVTVTYPSSESWHVNHRRLPKVNPWKLIPLQSGKRGRRVHKATRYLAALDYLDGHARRKFDRDTVVAVQRFQRDQGLLPDGIIGIHTWRQLQAAFRKYRRDGAGHRPGKPDAR